MRLVDILKRADKKIWEQYETVTNYCNKEYGWNNYDLARKMHALEWGGTVCMGSYIAISGITMESVASIVLGGLLSLASIPVYYSNKQKCDDLESSAHKLYEDTGTVTQPIFKPLRPLLVGLSTYCLGSGFYQLIHGREVPEQIPMTADEYNLIAGMIAVGISSSLFATESAEYFKDQIFNGPTKKKGFLKTLYEKVTGKLQPTPVPQLEPVKPTEYQSIDNIVEDA